MFVNFITCSQTIAIAMAVIPSYLKKFDTRAVDISDVSCMLSTGSLDPSGPPGRA